MRAVNIIASVALGVLFLIALAESDAPIKKKRSRIAAFSFLALDTLLILLNIIA